MTGALAWLNDLMSWVGRWIPRLLLIQPTHRGVRFGPTGQAKEVGPGLVLFWPITHVVVQVPINTQSIQLCSQLIPIAQDTGLLPRVVVCAACVQYRVVDPVRAAVSALNLHALVDNRASAAIARFANAEDRQVWADQARADVSEAVKEFGVHVERLDFTSQGVGLALKNLSDWAFTDNAQGTRAS